MRRSVFAGVTACVGVLVAACGIMPTEDATIDTPVVDAQAAGASAAGAPVVAGAANSVPRVTSQRVERWPDWSMPELGPFDINLPKEEMFRPCRDIPDEVATDLGIKINRDSEDDFRSFLCEAEFLDPELANTPVSFTSEDLGLSGWIERGNRGFDHFVDGFPEAVAMKATTLPGVSSVSCESMVETPRGVIAVGFVDASHEHPSEYLCVQTDRIIRELFER